MSKEYLLKTKLSLDIINIICKYEFTLENLQRIYKIFPIISEPKDFNYELISEYLLKTLKYKYTGFIIYFLNNDDSLYYFNKFKYNINTKIMSIKIYDKSITISLNGIKEDIVDFQLLNFL